MSLSNVGLPQLHCALLQHLEHSAALQPPFLRPRGECSSQGPHSIIEYTLVFLGRGHGAGGGGEGQERTGLLRGHTPPAQGKGEDQHSLCLSLLQLTNPDSTRLMIWWVWWMARSRWVVVCKVSVCILKDFNILICQLSL